MNAEVTAFTVTNSISNASALISRPFSSPLSLRRLGRKRSQTHSPTRICWNDFIGLNDLERGTFITEVEKAAIAFVNAFTAEKEDAAEVEKTVHALIEKIKSVNLSFL
jgi:hypothetical protein